MINANELLFVHSFTYAPPPQQLLKVEVNEKKYLLFLLGRCMGVDFLSDKSCEKSSYLRK